MRPGGSSSGPTKHSIPPKDAGVGGGAEARAEMVEGQSWAISRNGIYKQEDRARRKNVKPCSRLGSHAWV